MFSLWGIAPAMGRVFRDRRRQDRRGTGGPPQSSSTGKRSSRRILGHRNEQCCSMASRTRSSAWCRERSERGSSSDTDLFVALPLDAARTARDERRLFVTARLKPGVTRAQAEADLSGSPVGSRPNTRIPTRKPASSSVRSSNSSAEKSRRSCFCSRSSRCWSPPWRARMSRTSCSRRRSDVSTNCRCERRSAHSDRDHVKQVAVESLADLAAAGAAGLVLGGWGLALLKWLAGPQARLFGDAALNWRIVAVGIATAFVLPLGFAFIPALQSWRPNPADLKDGARAVGRRSGASNSSCARGRAGRAGRGAARPDFVVRPDRVEFQDDGERASNPRGVLTFRMDLPAAKYTRRANHAVLSRAADAHRRLPGVVSSGIDQSACPLRIEK